MLLMAQLCDARSSFHIPVPNPSTAGSPDAATGVD
jgi:hypothetical protein